MILLILIVRSDFIFGATHLQQQQQRHGLYISTPRAIGLLVLVSLVLCWRNMMTVYSSPYKIVLIYVRTMFAQSSCRLLVSEIAYGKFNYTVILVRRFAASANLAPHQSAQVIMEHGMWIFFFLKRLDFRVCAFRFFFRFSIRFAICFRIRLRKNVKAWYRR